MPLSTLLLFSGSREMGPRVSKVATLRPLHTPGSRPSMKALACLVMTPPRVGEPISSRSET